MNASNKVTIITAVIAALGVIIAALIGLFDMGTSGDDSIDAKGNTVSIYKSDIDGDIAGGNINK